MYWSNNKRAISRNECHKLKLIKKKEKTEKKRERERKILLCQSSCPKAILISNRKSLKCQEFN